MGILVIKVIVMGILVIKVIVISGIGPQPGG
jgi:hypothetical protein